MKKILLLIIAALLLNGCRFINTADRYPEAQESPKLIIPDGVDKPNSTATLEIPSTSVGSEVTEEAKSRPPDMAIRTKQSDNGGLRIENIGGYSVLIVKTEKLFMWDAMKELKIANWVEEDADEDSCIVTLRYIDQDALERKNAGFIKKIFTRDKYYTDYSGLYQIKCTESKSITQVKFSKQDGSVAKTFLADTVMNGLYDQFE
jgi:uncharacterized lipoprotein